MEVAKFCCWCLSSLNVSFNFLLLTQSSRVLRWLSGFGGTTGLAAAIGVGVGAVVGDSAVGVAAFVAVGAGEVAFADGNGAPSVLGLLRTCKI